MLIVQEVLYKRVNKFVRDKIVIFDNGITKSSVLVARTSY